MLNYILFVINLSLSYGFLYNIENSLIIRQPTINPIGNDDYFGYSVFMQKGSSSQPSILLVGAPKYGANQTGSVYKCPLTNSPIICEHFEAQSSVALTEIKSHSMFGATIDGGLKYGDPILICAPKFTQKFNAEEYNANGACYLLPFNESSTEQGFFPNSVSVEQKIVQNGSLIYRNAFGQIGFSMSYNEGEFLLGSPGDMFSRGDIAICRNDMSIVPPLSRKALFVIPSRPTNQFTTKKLLFDEVNDIDTDSYSGYAVTSGKFGKSYLKSYVIGQPKGKLSFGQVLIRNYDKEIKPFENTELYLPEEQGDYFGSSLCTADLNGDGFDDLLVGAQTARGDGYDQGAVYQYIHDNKGKLVPGSSYKITGNGDLARFGTAMVNLGRIDLTEYESVAISAPYEDDGRGVVYIYLGGMYGINNERKYRIKAEPSTFGFGYSLSRPVDVDNNNFKDIAVGAYKSNTAYVLKSRAVFKFIISITPSISSLNHDKTNEAFTISVCWRYESILDVNNLKIETHLKISIDDRAKSTIPDLNVFVTNNIVCQQFPVQLASELFDKVTPFEIKVTGNERDCPICPILSPSYQRTTSYKIPFLNNCGDDQICTPDVDISTQFGDSISNFIVGSKDSIDYSINLNNKLEPAYTCKLEVKIPNNLYFNKLPNSCHVNFTILECHFQKPIITNEALTIVLDMKKIAEQVSQKEFVFDMNLSCLNYTQNSKAILSLEYKNSYNIDRSSNPEVVEYKNENDRLNTSRVSHVYIIKNIGPSPVDGIDFTINIPQKIVGIADDIIHVNVLPFKNGYCIKNSQFARLVDLKSIQKGLSLVNCELPEIQCQKYQCKFNLLKKNEYVKIQIDMQVNIAKIISHFNTDFQITSTIEYEENNNKNTASVTSNFVEFNIEEYNFPWMWFIIGLLIAIIVLGLVVFGLYKLNFFSRPTHEKMMEEKEGEEALEAFAEVSMNATPGSSSEPKAT